MAKLTQQEIDAFLAEPRVVNLVTMRRTGTPHVAPVWFLWEKSAGSQGRAVVMADENAVKVRNIKRNPAVALSVATPERPLSYVVLEGRAELTKEGMAEIVERMCVLYDGPEKGKEFARELLADERMTLISIQVDRVISWKDD